MLKLIGLSLWLEQGHTKFETLSHDVASTKHARANACGHLHQAIV